MYVSINEASSCLSPAQIHFLTHLFLFHCLYFRVMIHIVAQCHEEGLEHYLRSYVKVKFPCRISQPTVCIWCLYWRIDMALWYSLYSRLSHTHPPPPEQCMKSWLKPWLRSWSLPLIFSRVTSYSRLHICTFLKDYTVYNYILQCIVLISACFLWILRWDNVHHLR